MTFKRSFENSRKTGAQLEDRLDGDFSPKPTVFLPSPAEINLHKTGTYLCLLESFFPDVIKIDWKEENSDTVLNSQQGETMKTGHTYMKFSWLTVTGQSMDKIHKCIVKHEFNRRGVDQEILFPSSLLEVPAIEAGKEPLKEVNDILRLQRSNTSAYYIYILLLFKSLIYFTCTIFYLFWRKSACSNRKFS
ncbi:TCR gamma alternate reading frame protein [Sorex fumeus]|uniref:TCR gamma alternate reading frame protein n=1 Tax=Sorex fumeus TaxID=62283 RepID=UPI0024ADCAE0|nr:TCR gamma alternate reading frame protein [Sorex fumeus]